ncbi:MAG: hypothetical protein DRP29_01915 [Thermodesulfobacteriota bacterium]|nr:MAG: hypothetical protein DRP29_01915 [Thermodesulfobacteriota bacterium]
MSRPLLLSIDFKKFTPFIISTGKFLNKQIYKDSKLILFHVIGHFFTPPAYLSPYLKIEKEKIEKRLLELIKPIENDGLRIQSKIILGKFWESLKRFIKDTNPELVIIGYKTHYFKVPTAEKMIERLETNFLVIKEIPLEKLEKILCAIDFSIYSLNALKFSFLWGKVLKSIIKIVKVNKIPSIKNKKILLEFKKEQEEKDKKRINNYLKNIRKEINYINYEIEIKFGNISTEILKLAEKEKFDLIVIGKRGEELEFGLGSVAREIIKYTKIPVMIVQQI